MLKVQSDLDCNAILHKWKC